MLLFFQSTLILFFVGWDSFSPPCCFYFPFRKSLVMSCLPHFALKQCGLSLGLAQKATFPHAFVCYNCCLTVTLHRKLGGCTGGWHLSDERFLQPVCVCKNMCASTFFCFFLPRKPKAQEFGPGSHLTSGAAGTQQWSAMGCRADQCHM